MQARLVTGVWLLVLAAGNLPAAEQAADTAARESSYNQDPASGKLEGRVLRIKRPLFMVRDLDRALDFYVDIVGLEVYSIEPDYSVNPDALGYAMFNVPEGKPRRSAMLNTSDEVRGLALQEIADMQIDIAQRPRNHTILFETDDAAGIRERARSAGYEIIGPALADMPATDVAPRLRFVEFGVVDPDGHVVAFFQYFDDEASWQAASKEFAQR